MEPESPRNRPGKGAEGVSLRTGNLANPGNLINFRLDFLAITASSLMSPFWFRTFTAFGFREVIGVGQS